MINPKRLRFFQIFACLSKVNYSVLFGIVSLTNHCSFIDQELKDVIPAELLPCQAH